MQDLSEEEKQKRIKATNANPWVQLAREGADVWNSYIRAFMKDLWWAHMLESLPESYSESKKAELQKVQSAKGEVFRAFEEKVKHSSQIFLINAIFTQDAYFSNFVFPRSSDFTGSFFECNCMFYDCIFFEYPLFSDIKICGSTIFKNCYFLEGAKFDNAEFFLANFEGTVFVKDANFIDAKFKGDASFKNVYFGGNTKFNSAEFTKKVDFTDGVEFSEDVEFVSTVFRGLSDFRGLQFNKIANFKTAQFQKYVSFNSHKTIFKTYAIFTRAIFEDGVSFEGTEFNSLTDFIGAKFRDVANFSKATFKTPPHFEGVDCDVVFFEDTKFENSLDKKQLHRSASAWAALIRLMERVHNLPMRQKFHEKLLEVEKRYSSESSSRWMYVVYSFLGYGREILNPFLLWVFVTLCSFLFNASLLLKSSAKGNLLDALAFTMVHSAPFFTTNKEGVANFLNALEENQKLSASTVGFFQTITCGILLFLIGLALRNRFRVK